MIYFFFEATLQVCFSFQFILFQRYYEKVGVDYPLIYLICVSQYKLSLKQKCLFPPSPSRGISKELKEVIAGQYAVSEGATGNCIFFSSVSVWIIFITGIMWLIYIVSVLLWSSKHFMATLVNPKALLWARYLTAFVLI